MRATLVALLMLLGLAACGTLPDDGPSARSIHKSSQRGPALYGVVDLDYATTQRMAALRPAALTGLGDRSSNAPTDLIAEGDTLGISVMEAGAGGLFARPAEVIGVDNQQTFPRLVVDQNGSLAIPFAGEVHLAGLTPREAAQAIQLKLRGRAVDPQVTVIVVESHANSVVVIGEVKASGHFPINAHNDRLLDVLASAGGPTRQPADLAVVVLRGGRYAQVPLLDLLNDPAQNIRLAPQDQVRVLYRPRLYSTFGALGHISQAPIENETLTLAAAISRAGGLETNSANPASVLVFRFERPEVAAALGVTTPPTAKGVPIVYRLNLRKPDGFFVAANFDIRADDMLYVPRSDITEAEKFLDVVNTVTAVTYNIRVSSVIP